MSEALVEPGKPREYVVLRQFQGTEAPGMATPQRAGWEEAGRQNASSAKAAISKFAGEKGGTFVAIPARSWSPMTVDIEQKATLKWS